METYKRKTRMLQLKPYCHMSDEHGFAEVTEWYNGEGFDIFIDNNNKTERISLTHGEWQALQVAVNWSEKGE